MRRVRDKRDPAAIYDWHDWFAWFPVTVPGPRPGTRAVVWLEWVERRFTLGTESCWEYSTLW